MALDLLQVAPWDGRQWLHLGYSSACDGSITCLRRLSLSQTASNTTISYVTMSIPMFSTGFATVLASITDRIIDPTATSRCWRACHQEGGLSGILQLHTIKAALLPGWLSRKKGLWQCLGRKTLTARIAVGIPRSLTAIRSQPCSNRWPVFRSV